MSCAGQQGDRELSQESENAAWWRRARKRPLRGLHICRWPLQVSRAIERTRQGLGEAERFRTSCESQSGGKQPLTGELLPRPCREDVMVAPNGSPKHRATCRTYTVRTCEAKLGAPCNGQSKRGQAASCPKMCPADGANISFAVDWMGNVLAN